MGNPYRTPYEPLKGPRWGVTRWRKAWVKAFKARVRCKYCDRLTPRKEYVYFYSMGMCIGCLLPYSPHKTYKVMSSGGPG